MQTRYLAVAFAGSLLLPSLLSGDAGQILSPIPANREAAARIYVADTGNQRVVRIDDMKGSNWMTYGSAGRTAEDFFWPVDIHVDRSGTIYVLDWSPRRVISMSDLNGKNLKTEFRSAANDLGGPLDLFVDDAKHIYVLDQQDKTGPA